LPTEAEWEYAARGGSTAARYGPLDDIAWYADNTGKSRLDSTLIWNTDQAIYLKRLADNGNNLHEVGQKRPNAFGLFDVLGNVWEWVNDWYNTNYYQSSPSQDPPGPPRRTVPSYPWRVRGSRGRSRFVPLQVRSCRRERQRWVSLCAGSG